MAVLTYRITIGIGFHLTLILLSAVGNPHDPLKKQPDLQKDLPKIVNMFSRCLIYLLNYPGLNIDAGLLDEPIILMRYSAYFSESSKYRLELTPAEIYSRNKTAIYKFARKWKGKDYFSSFLSESVGRATKRINCEARIYFNPPTDESSPKLYGSHKRCSKVLKHPFWISRYKHRSAHNWRNNFWSTIDTYSLLVLQPEGLESVTMTAWMNSCFYMGRNNLQYAHTLLAWNIAESKLSSICIYCDLCRPRLLNGNTEMPTNKHQLRLFLKTIKSQQISSKFYRVVVPGYLYPNYWETTIKRWREINLRELWSNLENINDIQRAMHTHIVSLIGLANSTVFLDRIGSNAVEDKLNKKIRDCGRQTLRPYCNIIPTLFRRASDNLARYQHYSLAFYSANLRFVSCHERHMGMLRKRLQMFTCLDAGTWILLIISFVLISQLAEKSNQFYEIVFAVKNTIMERNTNTKYTIGFQILVASFDQGCNLLQRHCITKNKVLFVATFALPLVLTQIGNDYKGDNITDLTLSAPLVRYDTFKKLIENNFKTFVLPWRMGKYDLSKVKGAPNKSFVQTSGHEAFPVVSHLWFYRNLVSNGDSKTLSALGAEIPKNLWLYFNHSKLFPSWRKWIKSHPQHVGMFDYDTFVIPHIERCDRSAVILDQHAASFVFTYFKNKLAPVWLGEDVIFTMSRGYTLIGVFPEKVLLRIRYLAQTGIPQWWEKLTAYTAVSFINANKEEYFKFSGKGKRFSDENRTGAHVLSTIPLIGCLSAAFVFLVHEDKAKCVLLTWNYLTATYSTLSKICQSVKKYKIVKLLCAFDEELHVPPEETEYVRVREQRKQTEIESLDNLLDLVKNLKAEIAESRRHIQSLTSSEAL